MNWRHLAATLWLRWRILRNRIQRTGKLSNLVLALVLLLGGGASALFFVIAMELGYELLPEAEPLPLMLAWGGLALGFLFAWMIGLMTDLQRSDAMSFRNLLHLPVSLRWVFLYNYLSSFVSLSIAIFLPAMLGLCLAMLMVLGPRMLLALPLLLGFFVMITALTYQLRGWLARLMEDKRRGRNVVAVITVLFVLLLQLPNLINLGVGGSEREARREMAELSELAEEEGPEADAARVELERREAEQESEEQRYAQAVTLGAILVPVGWLPYGVRASFEGRWWTGSLCALGMLSIGAWSLRRSYRSTMLSIVGGGAAALGETGDATRGASGTAVAALPTAGVGAQPAALRGRDGAMVERSLPFVGEQTAVIALANLRSLMRAPEAKMLMLSPLILLGLFAVMLSRGSSREALAAFGSSMSLGAIALGMLSILQLLQNQFGLDRSGFRAYVLSPVPRHRILLGKNLGTAPIGIGIGWIALVALQVLMPLDLAHFLGACLQAVSAYLLLCMLGNGMSILSPMRLKENALKAANAQIKTVLLQFLSVLLIPVALCPLMIPAGVEFLFHWLGWGAGVPLFLLLNAAELLLIWLFYRWILRRQGELLADREQLILEVLTRD